MPPKSTKKRTKGTKKVKKYYRRKKVNIPRPKISGSGLPPNYPMFMKYSDRYTLTVPALGVPICHQLNLNSLYDPDRTGVGHQPYFRDQMVNFYDNYKVISCTVKIVLQTYGSDNFIMSVRPDDNTTVVSNLSLEMERPQAPTILFSTVARPTVFKKTYYIHKILKMSKKEYLDDIGLDTPQGSNPALPAVLNICVASADTTAVLTTTAFMTFVMTFNVLQKDLTVQAQS